MALRASIEIVDVTADNVEQTGFFCLKSRRDSLGYRRKRAWLDARFAEGLRIKLIGGAGRGFIEYLPGEHGWRTVEAAGYMLIHCLWVVGQSKGHGFASRLLEACIADARDAGARGVAIVTSEGNWLLGRRFLLAKGFEEVDRAPPSFSLLVKRFGEHPPPALPGDWDARLADCGPGLTIVHTAQCPYVQGSIDELTATAAELGLAHRAIELTSAAEIRTRSPTAYGVFAVVVDGALLSHHPIGRRHLLDRLAKRRGG